MTSACVCGHTREEHGHDDAHPGSTACTECDEDECIAFEADEEQGRQVNDREATAEIFESSRSLLRMNSGVEISPGETKILSVRSRFTEFPERMVVVDRFEIEEISLSSPPIVLRSRDRNGPIDLASIDELLCRMIVPRGTGIAFSVRNVDDDARTFVGVIVSRSSVVEHREDLLITLGQERPGWWSEGCQRLVDLPEEEAKRIEGTLARCPDGSPRRDYRRHDAETHR